MAQQNINIGTSADNGGIIRRAAFIKLNANATDAESRLGTLEINKLDKITTDPQTVAGEVEFFSDITVPTASLILGKDGARIGSSARALAFTDAREKNTLFAQYSYDDTGGTSATYWGIDARQTFNVCPDSGVTLSDPQELAFSGATGNTLTRSFNIIPKAAGTLRVQSWEGLDDTGATLSDTSFEILPGDIDNITQLELKLATLSEVGDMQFVRFSGVQLSGSLSQSGGIFIGQECPYLDSELHLLTSHELVKQKTDFLDFEPQSPQPSYQEARIYYNADRETLDFYNNISDVTVNLPEESIQPVWNATGQTILNGEVVKLSGVVTGGVPNIELALADTVDNANASGVATHDIEDGTKGYITIIGSVGSVDTSSFSTGDILFLSNSTPGGLENIEQAILNPIALCLVSDAVDGLILVKPRGVINITAIAQTRGQGHAQDVTTTPVVCYCFDLAEFALNVDVNQTLNPGVGDGYNTEFSPISLGASGYYRFTFSVSLSSNDNERFTLEIYINSLPTGLVCNIDLNNPSTQYGTATISGVTESAVSPSDTLEIYIYHNGGAATDTVVYDSSLFGVERIGNA